MARNEAKIEWLRAVFDAKDTLFGPFSDTLTKTDKVSAWKSMHTLAQSLALVPNNKEYSYTRDTFWQNLRKNAVKKRDNSQATGSGTTKFTNIDEMVYSIIGKESPTLVGLPVAESDTLTKTDKVSAWKSMHTLAQSLALVPNNKEYSYTRDTFWQNLRKNAVKKRDNSQATGSGTTKFTNIDEMVYSIIGKESPTLVGLPVAESGELPVAESVLSEMRSNNLNVTGIDGSRPTSTMNIGHGEPSSLLAKKRSTSRTPAPQQKSQKKIQDLKYKKHYLMVKLLEKENYLKELKIKKIERELNIDSNERAKQANTQQVIEDASSSDEEQYQVDYLEEMDDSD